MDDTTRKRDHSADAPAEDAVARPSNAPATGAARPSKPEAKSDPATADAEASKKPGDADSKKRSSGDDHGQDKKAPGKQSEADQDADKPRKSFVRQHPLAVIAGAIVLVVAMFAGVVFYLRERHFEYTDDAFIDARQFPISPKVSGYLVDVPVTDNQYVETDTLIAQIDPRDYQNALVQAEAQLMGAKDQIINVDAQISAQQAQIDQAQAQLKQAKASLVFAQEQFDRAQALVKTGSGTVQNAQQTQSNLKSAQADKTRADAALSAASKQVDVLKAQRQGAQATVSANKAMRDQAALNLAYTTMKAAQAGRIVRLTGAKGQYVQPGQNISNFVPDPLWVTANFKETQITDMRAGQAVDIQIDAYPNRVLHGHVASIQPGSGTAFSLLPAENATGNYVKVVQRVPVKIVFDNAPKDVALGPGMSVLPSVRVR